MFNLFSYFYTIFTQMVMSSVHTLIALYLLHTVEQTSEVNVQIEPTQRSMRTKTQKNDLISYDLISQATDQLYNVLFEPRSSLIN